VSPRNLTRYAPHPEHHVYIKQDFYSRNAIRISIINDLIEKFRDAGMDVTQRSIFYALVARNEIKNSDAETSALSTLITNARLAGYIDPHAIDDPTRSFYERSAWYGPGDALEGAARTYQRRIWDSQLLYPELYVEKDAVVGYAWPKAYELHIPLYSGRGYSSWPGLFDAARRYRAALQDGRLVVAFHLGDHDPSGIDMTRNIAASLWLLLRDPDPNPARVGFGGSPAWGEVKPFSPKEYEAAHKELFAYGEERFEVPTPYGGRLIVKRLGLNLDMISEAGNFPPNPLKTKDGKLSDTRAPAYKRYMAARLGVREDNPQASLSWELDALPVIGEATAIGDLISEAVLPLIDKGAWDAAAAARGREARGLHLLADWVDSDSVLEQLDRFNVMGAVMDAGAGL
jgi:hypothetical protein